MKPVNLIAAVSANNGIGLKNALPWRLKKEMQYFSTKTTETKESGYINAVVMGRRSWEAIPPKFKPFKNRLNVVISRTESKFMDGIEHFTSVEEAVNVLQTNFPRVESIWIIGGAGIYKEALNKKLCNRLYITRIKKDFDCDVFFPDFDENDYTIIEEADVAIGMQEENGIQYEFKVYQRKS